MTEWPGHRSLKVFIRGMIVCMIFFTGLQVFSATCGGLFVPDHNVKAELYEIFHDSVTKPSYLKEGIDQLSETVDPITLNEFVHVAQHMPYLLVQDAGFEIFYVGRFKSERGRPEDVINYINSFLE